MTTTTNTGTKYEETKDLDIAIVAKLIRADLKAAGYKASVRISRYSMGRSVNVEIKALPKGSDLASAVVWVSYPGAAGGEYTCPRDIGNKGWFRACTLDAAEDLVNAYNRVSSDSQTDYYNAKFHGSVKLSRELLDAATEAAIAASAKPAKTAQVEMLEALGL